MGMFLRALSFCMIPAVVLGMQGCQTRVFNSDTEAYGNTKVHVVVAAPANGQAMQRLWICQGSKVAPGSNAEGYLVSIGIGSGEYRKTSTWTPETRNTDGSNLTPVGKFVVTEMVRETCHDGMTDACIFIKGLEPGINNNAEARGIAIHGTPPENYCDLGSSASHGCVRMDRNGVLALYDYALPNRSDGVRPGTNVYINSRPVADGANPCNFVGNAQGQAR